MMGHNEMYNSVGCRWAGMLCEWGVFDGEDTEASVIVVVTGTLHVFPFANPCPGYTA